MSDIIEQSLNTIRILSAEMVQKANSGHPGMPMGAAAMAYAIWMRHLRHNPANPDWPNRDRFILSPGHGSPLIYSMLHLTGYGLSIEDIKNFRQWDSLTPGHPESEITRGVEVCTGPLGQGFCNGVGFAIAERHLAELFNTDKHKIVDHYTYAIVSDGDLQEGLTGEAASYAGTQKLSKLIYLYDDNDISIEGSTDVTFREDVGARFKAYGWQVIGPVDGHDVEAVDKAIQEAKANTEQPALIICRTTIGYGAPTKAGSHGIHGAPLGAEELVAMKKAMGWPAEPGFFVPEEVSKHFSACLEKGPQFEAAWLKAKAAYEKDVDANLVSELNRRLSGKLPADWEQGIPTFEADAKGIASRSAGGQIINSLFKTLPDLLGGSADLAPSTNTWIKASGSFGWDKCGHNLQFGIREHSMGAMAVGMAHHGGVIPFTATFMVFADYMRAPIRLASLAKKRVVFIFTHDSIGVGEDGPTHQPVEQIASLRAIPGVRVFRPADANETAMAWRQAIKRTDGPTVLALSRQNLPTLDPELTANSDKGAYIVLEAEGGKADVVLVATGSEVHLALNSAKKLAEDGVKARVVSMPCWEVFDEQDKKYRDSVLLPGTPKVAVEAGCSMGWHRYIGENGGLVTIDRFGKSGPLAEVMKNFGFNVENVVKTVQQVIR
ncbi:MAG: transketolase [Gammaproteobacteria bacterium]|nr:transketolase [Gammaproteobacteria bacterium]